MRALLVFVLVVTNIVVLVPGEALAATGAPRVMNYQGRLMQPDGTLLGGAGTDYCFKFSFYSDSVVGAPDTKLWPSGSPSTTTVLVKSGVFNVGIGDTSAGGGDTLDYNFEDSDTVYLNVEVADKVGATCADADGTESYETLSPRQRIFSSGYAINSNTVGGRTAAQLIAAGFSTTSADYYVHSSSTIAKTYTNNTYTGTNTFTGTASTSNLVVSNGFTFGSISGILKSTLGVIAAAFVDLASDVTGILPVGNGGTGWGNVAAGAVLYGNGAGALATTTAGTDGQILALLNGVPTWTATSTYTYPLVNAGNTVSLAFGTTTNNTWSGTQAFANITASEATSTSLFASIFTSPSGIFGTLSATSSATFASTTAFGRFITGTIIATSTATSSIMSPLIIGTTTGSYMVSIMGSTTAPTSVVGTAVMAVTNNDRTLSSGNNVLRLNIRTPAGTNCTTGSTCPRFMEFFAGVATTSDTGGTGVGSLRLSTNGTGITQTSGAADFAEYMQLSESASVGDLVSLNSSGQYQRAVAGQSLIGVISDNPAFVGNAGLEGSPNAYIVGFAGVIQTTVSAANGAISAGDLIAASTTAGVGVKLTTSGYALGQALQSYSAGGTGTINVLVMPKYVDAAVALESYGGGSGGTSGYWSLATSTGRVSLASTTYSLLVTSASTTNITASYASSTQGFFGSLSIGSLGGFLKATAGVVSTAVIDLAADVTGILGVGTGGTGWANVASGAILYGNGAGALATTTVGTNGQVLALLNGIPTWTASTTFSAPLSYSAGAVSIAAANASTNGYLALGDWTTFNNKVSSSSLSATFPLAYNSSTGVFSTSFSTTTANSFDQLQTFGAGFVSQASSTVVGLLTSSNASTTMLTATTFCLTGDSCITTWPTGGAGVWPFTTGLTNFGTSTQATTTAAWYQMGLFASSTSQFVYASTTALSAATLCLNGDCRQAWPSAGAGAWPFTTGLTNFGTSTQATTTAMWFQMGLHASSTSQFTYASSTALSATTFCLSGDCRTSWPSAGAGAWPFTTGLTNFGTSTQATTTPMWYQMGLHASSTSQLANANIWSTLALKATSSALLSTDANGIVISTTIDPSLSFSANTLGLDLSNPNIWTGLQTFGNASSTAFSALDYLAVGRTATTTIRGEANATSTFAGGVQALALNITGSATSTFADGIDITDGCFSINGTCIGGSSGFITKLAAVYATSSPGTTTVAFTGSADSNPTWSAGALTLPNNTAYYNVEVWGGGGGGGAQATNAGAAGANSCYSQGAIACESPLVRATGGLGGAAAAGVPGAGGTGLVGALLATGGSGARGGAGANTNDRTGIGGDGAHGGGAGGASSGTGAAGENGQAPGGGGEGGFTTTSGGSGGGGGGFAMDVASTSVKTASTFVVGNGGNGGTAGTQPGGRGGHGGVVITIYATSTPDATGYDYAEMYPVSNPMIEAGDIVAVDAGVPVSMKLALKGDTAPLAGVISTEPGQTLGDINEAGMRPIALSGRVPVKVNLEGGVIKTGDRIAVSSVPGVGKKAGSFDDSVGIAIDSFDGTGDQQTVMVFLDLQKGTEIDQVAVGLLGNDASFLGLDVISGPIDFVGAMMSAIAARIHGFATATTSEATSTPQTATATSSENVLSGIALYNLMKNLTATNATSSQLAALSIALSHATIDTLEVDAIKPIEKDVQIKIGDDGKFIIAKAGEEDMAVSFDDTSTSKPAFAVSIDALGNALFAGALTAANFEVGSAEKPGGITMYDTDTGEPYCTRIVGGTLKTESGKCGGVVAVPISTEGGPSLPAGSSPPIIIIQGNNPAYIDVGATYADLGATVTDDHDNNLGIHTYVDGVEVQEVSIDTSVSGTHTIHYRATDTDGNISEEHRVVVVGEEASASAPPAPAADTESAPETTTESVDTTPEPAPTPVPTEEPTPTTPASTEPTPEPVAPSPAPAETPTPDINNVTTE